MRHGFFICFKLFLYGANSSQCIEIKQFCEAAPILIENLFLKQFTLMSKIFQQQTYYRGLDELNLRGGGCDPRKSLFKSLL